ncbi:MAG TPA: MBL fold metallo-hydrolase, partial [Anaerolineae bacterium]|nr:MBL fold metallo-hydrolase [Anaerolineae bacterium]
MMQIQFWGAAKTVTGTMHVLTINGQRLLLDCGMFQGKRDLANERNSQLPFDAKAIDACVLSHAHMDHSGTLPVLTKSGYDGPIYCTSATRDLCSVMLRDSAHIQEGDANYLNKRNAERGRPLIKPIYNEADVVECLQHFVAYEYHRPFEVLPGVRVTLRDAGHILGSAEVIVDYEENTKKRRLVFTGDLGRKHLPILRDPEPVDRADLLITEGTYGGRFHDPIEDTRDQLAQIIVDTYERQGVLIIPAFAVGRTQDIVYDVQRLVTENRIPDLPFYVDSPLATNVTEIFRLHPECYDEEILSYINDDPDGNAFGWPRLRYVRSADESKALNESKQSCVIIAASGMCEAGRVLHHLKHHIEDSRTTVLFVGYQAENTLGRKILDGDEIVKIFGDEYQVRAQIKRLGGYSGHGDHNDLVGFAH